MTRSHRVLGSNNTNNKQHIYIYRVSLKKMSLGFFAYKIKNVEGMWGGINKTFCSKTNMPGYKSQNCLAWFIYS